MPICVVPITSSYDAKSNNSNSFFLSLKFSSTPEVKTTKSVNKIGEEVAEKEYKNEGQVN